MKRSLNSSSMCEEVDGWILFLWTLIYLQ